MITRSDSGNFLSYRLDGQLHRPNGPANIDWRGDWSWWLNGNRHRYYGPQKRINDWHLHDEKIK